MSAEQVQAVADNLLTAYNLGSYEAFSRDLSLPAKLIVDEKAFSVVLVVTVSPGGEVDGLELYPKSEW